MDRKPRKCSDTPKQYDICIQCKTPLMEDESHYYLYIGNISICTRCAEVVANCFNKRHSGDWLTWRDE